MALSDAPRIDVLKKPHLFGEMAASIDSTVDVRHDEGSIMGLINPRQKEKKTSYSCDDPHH